LQQRLREVEAALGEASSERASLQNRLDRAREQLKLAEEAFAAGGGKHWEQREQYGLRLAEMKNQKSQVEKQLLELTASELPLSLVPDLLEAVDRQGAEERGATEAELIGTLLSDRDQQLLTFLKT
jgi:DNA sulfur modification protein DndD